MTRPRRWPKVDDFRMTCCNIVHDWSKQFNWKFNRPVDTKMIRLQNPPLRFHKLLLPVMTLELNSDISNESLNIRTQVHSNDPLCGLI